MLKLHKLLKLVEKFASGKTRIIQTPFKWFALQISWLVFKQFPFLLIGIHSTSHARLNSHYEAWSYKKKKHKKIKAYGKSVQKEPTVKRCLLILHLKPLRLLVKRKHSIGRTFYSLAVRGRKLLTQTYRNGNRKIMQSIRITSRPPSRKRKGNQSS